jgi:hypothetical protein
VGVLEIESFPHQAFKTVIPVMVLVFVQVIKPHLVHHQAHNQPGGSGPCLLCKHWDGKEKKYK